MKKIVCAVASAMLVLCGCGGGGGKKVFSSLADFAGAKMGVLSGSAHVEAVDAVIPNVRHNFFNTTPDIVVALQTGKIDVAVLDMPLARELISKNAALRIFPDPVAKYDYGFPFAKGSELGVKANEVLARLIRDGTTGKLEEIWFSADESKKVLPKLDYKPDFDGSAGTIRYACDATLPPACYTASDGRVIGLDIDIANRIAYELNMNLEVSSMLFDALLPALASGKADMLGGMFIITEERTKAVDFAGPHLSGRGGAGNNAGAVGAIR